MVTRCNQCGLEPGRFGVLLSSDGLCNYCEHWNLRRASLTDYVILAELLRERVERSRGSGAYDALIGFSGGKDSTFVVHALTQRFGLKVLAVTFANGFLTDHARQNIVRTVDALGIDHYFHTPDWDVHKAFYEAALRTYGDPCIACAMGIYFHSIKTAYEKSIPLVVHGRSPYQIFRNYYPGSPDDFLPLHESNYQPYSATGLLQIYSKLDGAAREWLARMFADDGAMCARVYQEFFLDPQHAVASRLPDFVGLFQYLGYDEENIKSEMERAVGYRRPQGDDLLGHGDCSIHDASGYVFRRLHGVSAVEIEIAAMRRHGALAAAKADTLRAKKDAQDAVYPDASVRSFCDKLAWSKERFDVEVESLVGRIREKFPCH